MYGGDKDGESARTKPCSQDPTYEDPDASKDVVDFSRESEKASKFGNSGSSSSSRELTLSYLCDNNHPIPKLGFSEPGEKASYKGKEVVSETTSNQGDRWVERDFLSLNGFREGEGGGDSSKREIHDDFEGSREKKPKLETLNLSLALPDVSLSLTGSDSLPKDPNPHPHLPVVAIASAEAPPKPARSIHSLAPSLSNNNTQTTCSNDFTAPSLSYSYSRPFSHNPSCSLTRNSTDFEYCGGEGTNGSVHSRFKPVGDGVLFSNHGGGGGGVGHHLMNGGHPRTSGSLHRTASSDSHSFFPSELPARPKFDGQSNDSRGKGSELMRGFEYGGRARRPSRPERIIREIVSESVPVTAQMIQELPQEAIELTKEYLRNLIEAPEKREGLVALQSRLDRRSDLTMESLSKAHKDQLEILVAIRTGLSSFLSGKNQLLLSELLEMFLFIRCRNVNCKSLLPVDDCDCKICSGNKGFCRECMCPVCLSFDCANNTCSWVGCDVCSHWCHAACGIRKNLIKPGRSLTKPCGATEMLFHCIGCGHASEMFGFVKDVFLCCSKDWGLETLVKELNCVSKIFMGSEDFKGKELQSMAEEMLLKLDRKIMSPLDACTSITQFFNYMDGLSEFPASSMATSKGLAASTLRTQVAPLPQPSSLAPKHGSFHTTSSSLHSNDLLPHHLQQNGLNAYTSLFSDRTTEDGFLQGKQLKKDNGLDNLESIARVKELEARMFQTRADNARREAEQYLRMVRASSEKLEEEYAEKLAKLCLKEAEERRRKKLEDLKVVENSRCDYYKMKMRMQADIAGLLERMEASKQQWA